MQLAKQSEISNATQQLDTQRKSEKFKSFKNCEEVAS